MSRRVFAPRSSDVPRIPGFAEEMLPLTSLMPTQFRDLWAGSGESPERELAAAVIGVTAHDLRTNRYARRGPRQRIYVRAYEWLTSEDREWPFSFINLCDVLKLSPAAVREHLLDLSPPAAARDAEAA
ncbi:MAG TPA: hypothetical protein VL049_19960 [Candidatus Dormibacteraeota bacterium]|nr:hypothetical protein [Candidatus Dormibacteraeota bacterium]